MTHPTQKRLNPHQKVLKLKNVGLIGVMILSQEICCLFLLLIKSVRLECLAQVLKILWLPCATP